MARRRSRCGTLKEVRAKFQRAVRAAVKLASSGNEYAAGEHLKRAHAELYWCAQREGYADVAHWQARYRRGRRHKSSELGRLGRRRRLAA